MNNCEVTKKQLATWILGLLSEQEANELSVHIEQCPHCTKRTVLLKDSCKVLGQLKSEEVPELIKQRIMTRA